MISVCIITKNEINKLNRCLKSIKKYSFDLVVVDTGSTDDTISLAKQYTSQVYSFPWIDDFSAARNYAIEKAKNDMILMMDSDEILTDIDLEKLATLLQENSALVGRVLVKNLLNDGEETVTGTERISRLFSKKWYHYTGRIHEQITSRERDQPLSLFDVPIEMLHDGYQGSMEEKKVKAQRNLTLIARQISEEGKDPYLLYQAGKSCYFIKEYDKAILFFEEAFAFDLNPSMEYVIDMVETYGYSLLNNQQADKALDLEGIYDSFQFTSDFCFLMGLIYMNNQLYPMAIEQFELATKKKITKMEGTNSFKAYYNIGVIYECLDQKEMALSFYSRCDQYPLALRQKEKLLGTN